MTQNSNLGPGPTHCAAKEAFLAFSEKQKNLSTKPTRQQGWKKACKKSEHRLDHNLQVLRLVSLYPFCLAIKCPCFVLIKRNWACFSFLQKPKQKLVCIVHRNLSYLISGSQELMVWLSVLVDKLSKIFLDTL